MMDNHEIKLPTHLTTESKVTVVLPDEILQLARDLHADRVQIGLGIAVLVAAVAMTAFKYVFGRK